MDRRHQTWATSERFVPQRFVRPFVRFTRIEAASGIVLLAATIVALVWANSRWSASYFQILDTRLIIDFGPIHFDEDLQHVVNDGLMAIFFFVVGLEIKRQVVHGDLSDRRTAALPVMAAVGGMVFPALIYVLINRDVGEAAIQGWGVPMATDIAFAVGVLAILGSRIPSGARLFLLTLAIVDDIGAISVIAIFYTDDLRLGYLALAIGGLVMAVVATRVGIRSLAFYVPLGVIVWFFTFESGVHATLAGVALGFLTPARPMYPADEFDRRARAILDSFPDEPDTPESREHADHEALLLSDISSEAVSPLSRLEYRLQTWSSFVVIPLFALANAGIDFRDIDIGAALTSTIALGVILGLVLGKTIGISLLSLITVKTGLGRLPDGTSWLHILGLSVVGGIGFTVSLFIASLAFDDPALNELAKVGILAGSLLAGLLGAALLLRARPEEQP
ncbi:MAG: Na+/H+ antiporter NhaA [Acidimicrobiia bacterium]